MMAEATAPPPTRDDAAIARIDEALKVCSGRTLVPIDELTDTLLDVRRIITENKP